MMKNKKKIPIGELDTRIVLKSQISYTTGCVCLITLVYNLIRGDIGNDVDVQILMDVGYGVLGIFWLLMGQFFMYVAYEKAKEIKDARIDTEDVEDTDK